MLSPLTKRDAHVKAAEQGAVQVPLAVGCANNDRTLGVIKAFDLTQQHRQDAAGGLVHVMIPGERGGGAVVGACRGVQGKRGAGGFRGRGVQVCLGREACRWIQGR